MSHLLQKERECASFNIKQMTYFFDHSKEWTEKKQLAYQIVERDPVLNYKYFFDLDHHQAKEHVMKMIRRAVQIRSSISNDPLLVQAFDEVME
jgi:hypothetical protein